MQVQQYSPTIRILVLLRLEITPLINQISKMLFKAQIPRRNPARIAPQRHISFVRRGRHAIIIVQISGEIDEYEPGRSYVRSNSEKRVLGGVKSWHCVEFRCFDEGTG